MKNYTDKNIIHIKDGDLEYLQFKILNKYGIKHCITLRHGGVSKGKLHSLNFRLSGTDNKENVFKNLKIICNSLDLDSNEVYKAIQAHTDKILVIDNENKNNYKYGDDSVISNYDAYIVKDKGISTLITTADCNPIIIYDTKNNIVANVHSGWKGTISKICIKTCEKMINEFSSKAKDLIVCIGPSIRKCCFSSEEKSFKQKFTQVWENEEEYIYYEKDNKRFHIDLVYLIKKDLERLGVKNIVVVNICTACNSEDFFSYRVATKNNQKDYGLMGTIVSL